jgi:hypothetical protein
MEIDAVSWKLIEIRQIPRRHTVNPVFPCKVRLASIFVAVAGLSFLFLYPRVNRHVSWRIWKAPPWLKQFEQTRNKSYFYDSRAGARFDPSH